MAQPAQLALVGSKRPNRRADVLRVLQSATSPMTAEAIGLALGVAPEVVSPALSRLEALGQAAGIAGDRHPTSGRRRRVWSVRSEASRKPQLTVESSPAAEPEPVEAPISTSVTAFGRWPSSTPDVDEIPPAVREHFEHGTPSDADYVLTGDWLSARVGELGRVLAQVKGWSR